MSAIGRLLGWQRTFITYAWDGEVVSDAGTAHLRGSASIASGLGREVLRLYDGDARVVDVPDFTSSRVFTFLALVRAPAGNGLRRIAERVNGGTEVSLSISAAGQLQGVFASARGNYRRVLTGTSNIADGRWHAVAIIGGGGLFNATNLRIVVDGEVEATGSISPGLFGTSPDFRNGAPIIVGRSADTTNNLNGEVAAVVGVDQNWTDETFATLASDMSGYGGRGFVGWGIPLS